MAANRGIMSGAVEQQWKLHRGQTALVTCGGNNYQGLLNVYSETLLIRTPSMVPSVSVLIL